MMAIIARNEPERFARSWSIGAAQCAADAIADNTTTREEFDDAVFKMIRDALRKKKRPETLRGVLLTYWGLIAPLAQSDPDAFDQILIEYLEARRMTVLR